MSDKIIVKGKLIEESGQCDWVKIELSPEELVRQLPKEYLLITFPKIIDKQLLQQFVYACCYVSAKDNKSCPIHGKNIKNIPHLSQSRKTCDNCRFFCKETLCNIKTSCDMWKEENKEKKKKR